MVGKAPYSYVKKKRQLNKGGGVVGTQQKQRRETMQGESADTRASRQRMVVCTCFGVGRRDL